MEGDDREGIIIDYLDKLLPINWDKMDLYERRNYLNNYDDNTDISLRFKRDKVCIMEIWCDCFFNERQNIRRYDSFEIEGILNRIGGWVKHNENKTGKTKFQLYGIQKTFIKE